MHTHTHPQMHTYNQAHTQTHSHAHAHTHAHTHTSLTYLWNGDCSAKSTSNDIPSRFRFCIGVGSHGEGGDSGWDWFS